MTEKEKDDNDVDDDDDQQMKRNEGLFIDLHIVIHQGR